MDTWKPKILSDYELGSATAAIQAIALSGKPVAEVGCRRADLADLEADLQGCLRLADAGAEIQFWTKAATGGRYRYGFYAQPWVLSAIDFLDRADLAETDRSWINGLLFGYRTDAIQQFIDRSATNGKQRAV